MAATASKYLGAVEHGVWIAYLILFSSMTFISGAFHSVSWALVSIVFYSMCIVYLIVIGFGVDYNSRALYRSRWLILVALFSIVWLLLQTCLPASSLYKAGLLVDQSSLSWFKPKYVISVDPVRTWQLLHFHIFSLAWMVLTLCLIRDRQRAKQIVMLVAVLLACHALFGIVAKLSGTFLIDKQQVDGHFSAARGWFVNRNHFAALLLLSLTGILPWLINLHSSSVSRLRIMIASAGLLLAIVAIVLSESRAGLLCLMICIVLAFIAFLTSTKVSSPVQPTSNRNPLILYTLFLASISVGLVVFGGELLTRLQSDFLSLGERTLQWQITWQAIIANPWFGYGGGSYAQVFQTIRDHADLRATVFDQSHNDYLQIWLEQGLLGFTLWLIFLTMIFVRSWRAATRSKSSFVRAVVSSGLIVIFAALLQSLVDFNLQIASLRCYFFVIIALVMAVPTVHRNR